MEYHKDLCLDLCSFLYIFSIYSLGQIIRKHGINFHCYADDTQLYPSVKPDEVTQLSQMEACLLDTKEWMTQNFLLLNSDKTDDGSGAKSLRHNLSAYMPNIDGISITSSAVIKDLGVTLDSDLLSGCANSTLKGLQLIQNAAARILTRTRRFEHISPVLASLHWLPVTFLIHYKILLLTFKALHGLAPLY